jgi:RES domain-containing protein
MTVRAWRIVKTRHVAGAFSGEGARVFGGRWTSKGVASVYVASTQALAALEMLVHLEAQALLAHAYAIIPVEFDASLVLSPAPADLPPGWTSTPPPEGVRAFGDAWIASRKSPVLRVPSVLVPGEPNYLLDPKHPGFARVTIGQPMPFRFDPRLGPRRPEAGTAASTGSRQGKKKR